MHIAVIAANGRLGKTFVEAALEAGHSVRAGIRRDNNLTSHPHLEVVTCDAVKLDDVRGLLRDQDVVVSAIGHVKNSAPDIQTLATKNIITAMNEMGMRRFVDVTGTGVRFPGDRITIVDRVLNLAVQIIDSARVKDGRNHQDLLKASDLDWTTIRILKLQDTTKRPYVLRQHGPTKWYVGRQEVAEAMLEVIQDGSFVRQAPIISKS